MRGAPAGGRLSDLSRRLVAATLDIVIVVTALGCVAIVLTGGTALTLGHARISLRGIDNPLIALAVLVGVRYLLRRWPGCWDPRDVDRRSIDAIARIAMRWRTLPARRRNGILLLVCVSAMAIKSALAWGSPGFFSGDDVEIHEMSVGLLLHRAWPIWDLRNAFYPIGVIYPAQWTVHALGLSDPHELVFAGRFVVAILSSLTILLLPRATGERGSVVALCAVLFVATNKLQMAFGSTELPRPVSTLLLVAAYVLVNESRRAASAAVGGALIGAAGALRFSEIIFVLPAAAGLVLGRRWRAALSCTACALAVFAALIAVADHLYWGSAFHSLRAATDYTLVRRLSSRGYQSPLWYVTAIAQWTNVAAAALLILGISKRRLACALWVLLPIGVLSFLPHKEARYLIPITPFAAMLAADGLKRAWLWVTADGQRLPVALGAAAVMLGCLQDAGHWRLPRSNADVTFAQRIGPAIPAGGSIAAEQLWRMGGRLYLDDISVRDLDPGQLSQPGYLWPGDLPRPWLVFDERSIPAVQAELLSRGYVRTALAVPGSRLSLWHPPE